MPERDNNPDNTELIKIAELIRSRRTINFFRPDPVPDSLIREAIEVARWAPNHKLTEPWHFYILGKQSLTQVKNLITEIKSTGQSDSVRNAVRKRLDAIPGWLVVTCKKSAETITQMEDYAACSCAVQNMMLYLWSAGIGVKWTTGKVIRDDHLFGLLNLQDSSEMIVGLFWYGYPEVISAQNRKAVAEILSIVD
jgi:nitroreductase